jgi:hypothetical protein
VDREREPTILVIPANVSAAASPGDWWTASGNPVVPVSPSATQPKTKGGRSAGAPPDSQFFTVPTVYRISVTLSSCFYPIWIFLGYELGGYSAQQIAERVFTAASKAA